MGAGVPLLTMDEEDLDELIDRILLTALAAGDDGVALMTLVSRRPTDPPAKRWPHGEKFAIRAVEIEEKMGLLRTGIRRIHDVHGTLEERVAWLTQEGRRQARALSHTTEKEVA